MPLIRTPSLVLHSFPYGETSRILRILTPEHGLRSLIAKGAQRPKSRFGGILEPFTTGEALFNLREGRDLLTLAGFTLSRSRQAIGRDLAAFSGASVLAEIALRTGTEEPNAELYDAVSAALDQLATARTEPVPTALAGIWHIITILGFQPELDLCVRCGRQFGADEPTRFDIAAGGAVCRICRPTGRLVDARTREEIRLLSTGALPAAELASRALHAALLHAFLTTHLAVDRPLRSLALFLENVR